MKNKKLFILVPDGVGLRNFAYGGFCAHAKAQGFDVTFWNDTAFDLTTLGFQEIKISGSRPHPMTYVLKNVRIQVDLNRNIRKSKDRVYDSYRFGFSYSDLKQTLRSWLTRASILWHDSDSGIGKVRAQIKRRERSTPYYRQCLETLKAEQPDLIFCTNQRTVSCMAPVLAAQDLGIPTATFIFSWDNLPKATMALEPDFYVVWSAHMKKELQYYYDYIADDQIFVTGTPQFEPHSDESLLVSREAFFAEHQLDPAKKYICYSGDDVTTSPNDAQYLADTAQAIRQLNAGGAPLGLLFRRCPVDFSDRYDRVLTDYKDVIVPVNPKWEKVGGAWNAMLPTKADLVLQMNTIAHTEMVINLGSSMVFDYASFGKSCAYINYDVAQSLQPGWSVKTIYNFMHFRSMPSKDAVVWLNSADEIADKVNDVLSGKTNPVTEALRWFERINMLPAADASQRMLSVFDEMIRRKK